MKLTNELKAKFFALYWGQRVLNHKEVNRLYRVVNLLELKNDVWEAHLKPLSAITDEDAIEVAIIAGNSSYTDDRRAYNGRLLLQEFLRRQCNVYGEDWLKLFDYLRSRGYALPYMGISVEQQVEAGWVKLIEK